MAKFAGGHFNRDPFRAGVSAYIPSSHKDTAAKLLRGLHDKAFIVIAFRSAQLMIEMRHHQTPSMTR